MKELRHQLNVCKQEEKLKELRHQLNFRKQEKNMKIPGTIGGFVVTETGDMGLELWKQMTPDDKRT